jgi:hypothetical protein|tara:strand:- start:1692 stop:2717 length:1026 start_codon:yes stop_codon:yes gene_type:complete
MAMQQVEYEFPDSDSKSTAVTVDLEEKEDNGLEVEGAVGREDMKVPAKKSKPEELEIEIEDDTPKADRGRKPSKPPEEVTDEELENYSDKVKGRIKHLSKGYHDERRAKETALREREELENYAKNLMSENNKLKGTVDKNHNTLIQSAKKQVEGEMANAKRQYKEAYESGESDAVLEAQTALNVAQIRMAKVNGIKPKQVEALQPQATPVKPQVEAPPANVQRDEKAESWREENSSWFGEDDEMTALAYGLHHKLTKEGVDPTSDTYYEKINSRMRQVFPDQFDEELESTKRKSSNVVAPATRSTSPKKVTLNQSQVAIAKRLGISLEDYAKQAAELMRNK